MQRVARAACIKDVVCRLSMHLCICFCARLPIQTYVDCFGCDCEQLLMTLHSAYKDSHPILPRCRKHRSTKAEIGLWTGCHLVCSRFSTLHAISKGAIVPEEDSAQLQKRQALLRYRDHANLCNMFPKGTDLGATNPAACQPHSPAFPASGYPGKGEKGGRW